MAINMTAEDKKRLEQAGAAWQKANASGNQAGMDAAHAAAEQIRAKYGYSGGDDGTQVIKLPAAPQTQTKANAYTPIDNSGRNYADLVGMSAADKAALNAAGAAWQKANAAGDKAGMDAAHKQAESIRQSYGYSGGEDGSQYIKTSNVNDIAPSYQTALQALMAANKKAPTYANSYEGQLKDIYDQIVNRDKFQYDIDSDMLYRQYAQQYQDMGRLAMQDTLGQAAALTGGYSSSYGQAVGQQQYDAYLQKLNDVVPELYSQAYQQYQDEGDKLLQQYSMMGDLADREYKQYSDAYDRWLSETSAMLGQYNNDRNFAYQKETDDRNFSYQQSAADRNFNFQKEQADREYQLALDKFTYQKQQDAAAKQEAEKKSRYDADTAAMQRKLNSLGANLEVDGIWGPATQAAYEKYLLAPDIPDDATVSNRHTDSWIQVGTSRYTWQEVEQMVNSGKMKETYNSKTKTVSYTWAK